MGGDRSLKGLQIKDNTIAVVPSRRNVVSWNESMAFQASTQECSHLPIYFLSLSALLDSLDLGNLQLERYHLRCLKAQLPPPKI
jgi:hypothetical protein